MDSEKYWANELDRYSTEGLIRQVPSLKFIDATHCIDGKNNKLFVVCTNDYFGFRFHPEVIKAASMALGNAGVGAGGARSVIGSFSVLEELERELADFQRCDAALIFNTGYMANVGLISVLADSNGVIFSDEKNHASIIDGCRLSRAKIVVYPHRNVEYLKFLLEENKNFTMRFIATEGVFSMDGTIAPLPDLLDLAEKFDAHIILDNAHSLGVLGDHGYGTLEHFGITFNPRIIHVGTLSKVLGSFGGFVCGSKLLINFLRHHSRPFLCSTSLPESMLAASLKALRLLKSQQDSAHRLKHFSQIARDIFSKYEIAFPADFTGIFPLITGDENLTMQIFKKLYQSSIYLVAIRYPSVPRGSARLRLTVCSEYEESEWREALHTIAKAIKSVKT
ncbi:MAG: aminotransferase class I/II-fold pyridoxal phosphate-dependent enzyme [Puniceicoccales bacterium]|jgi:8-amino-7-oxononanoate synthase|nr:aminotransferase class I/II-fold pyridoxal phosphate-dependent enzyme [Puniceicoccales bacterium]